MSRLLVSLSFALATLAAQAQDTIRVYNWNDYIAPQVLADFEKETGIRVEYHTYSTSAEINKLLSSDEAIDVAMPPHDLLAELIQAKRLQPLDFNRLPNRVNLDRDLLAKLSAVDPDNRHALPYLWASTGIAVNRPQAEAAFGGPLPESWSLLFDSHQSQRLASCGISLLDAPSELYSALLNYQGHRLARTTPSRIKRASATLLELKPHLRYIDSERYIDDLKQGRLCLAMAWSGDALAAAASGQPVTLIIPEEGTALSIDSMVIPSTSTQPALAYRFIDFLMRPQVAASITNATFYASANSKAQPFVAEELRDNPVLYPDRATKRRLALLEVLGSKQQAALDTEWNAVLEAR